MKLISSSHKWKIIIIIKKTETVLVKLKNN